MNSGTVKRVESERGFGFIADASGTEYFFHRTSIADFDSLRGGESVTFEMEEGPKGKRANNVKVGAPVAETPAPAAEASAPEAEASAPEAEASEAPAEDESPAVSQA
jgi:CspA family cold shock protein